MLQQYHPIRNGRFLNFINVNMRNHSPSVIHVEAVSPLPVSSCRSDAGTHEVVVCSMPFRLPQQILPT
ncbi:hypothetical protein BCR43DRAFT_497372 [Syncephalastrum racemosum]|uniref:Uncharacterized protein n=1 Tax=Syncephalastrum racemosum TaxID=13706 RepID=A0A1X2H220_SYNRA|nr:hypothetical protein BCR43DRAFT_497372 [Syncephalastrum racemosum]